MASPSRHSTRSSVLPPFSVQDWFSVLSGTGSLITGTSIPGSEPGSDAVGSQQQDETARFLAILDHIARTYQQAGKLHRTRLTRSIADFQRIRGRQAEARELFRMYP